MGLKDVVRVPKECIRPGCWVAARTGSNYCALHDSYETAEEIWFREAQAEVDAICTSLKDAPPQVQERWKQSDAFDELEGE